MARILVVDDEKSIRITVQEFLKDDGHDVQTADDAIAALELLKEKDFDVVVTDVIMPKMSGVKLLQAIREVSEYVQVVMMTGGPTIETVSEALRLGAFDYLTKPVTKEAIVKTVTNAAKTKFLIDEKMRLEEDNRRYQEDLELMVEDATKALRVSEQKFRDLSDLLPEIIYEMDVNGDITYVNKIASEKTGYSQEEFREGINVSQLLVPGDMDRAKENISRIAKGEVIGANEYSVQRKDGFIFPCVVHSSPIIQNNRPDGLRGIISDITERKQMEEDLKASEEKYRFMIENQGEGITVVDSQEKFLFANPAAEEMFGVDAGTLVGRNVKEFLSEGMIEIILNQTKKREQRESSSYELEITQLSEEKRQILITATPQYDEDNIVIGSIGIFRDITERKQTEEKLHKSEKKFRRLVESLENDYIIYSHDTQGVFTYLSPSIFNVLGYTQEEFIGHYSEYMTDSPINKNVAHYTEAGLCGEKQLPYEAEFWHKNGRRRLLEVMETPIYDKERNVVGIEGIVHDITERKQAEEALKASEERYRSYIELTGQLGWTTNAEGEVEEDIPSWRAYTGQSYDEVKGWGWGKALHPDDTERSIRIWTKSVETKSDYETEYRVRGKDGIYHWFLARGVPLLQEDGSILEWVGTCIDITERKQAEEALRDSEARLNEAQRIAQIGSWELDLITNTLHWSDEVYRIFDLKPQQFGNTYEAFLNNIHPDDRDLVNRAYTDSVKNRTSYDIIHRLLLKDRSIRYVNERCETFYDDTGKADRSIGTVQDITDRKRAEEGLRESKELFDVFMDNIPAAILIKDHEGQTRYRNQYLHDLLADKNWIDYEGYKQDPHEFKRIVKEAEKQVIRDGDTLQAVISPQDETGNVRHYETIKFPIDRTGKSRLLGGVALDITERKLMEDALKVSEAKFRNVIENTNDAIYLLYKDRFVLTNKKFSEMIGVTSEEAASPGFNLMDFVAPESREAIAERGRMRERGEEPPSRYEFVALNTKGERIIIDNSIGVIDYQDGKAVLGVLHDITERRHLRDQLQQERDNLEEMVARRTKMLKKTVRDLEESNLSLKTANRHKDNFLSAMSHELRTPLSAIIGFGDLLSGQFFGELNEKQLSYVEMIDSSGKHLLELISDLLDMAKIDAGKIDIDREDILLNEFIGSAVSMVSVLAHEKSISIETKVDPDVKIINADRLRTKQILLNLLTNAVKFTEDRGCINIRVSKEGDESIKIEIEDNGIGIAPDELDKIFSEFHQADKIRDRSFAGVGIGLALSRRLVEIHGGEIGVRSKLKEGSTFWFTLPLIKPGLLPTEDAVDTLFARPKKGKHRILIADDSKQNQTLLIDMLSMKGYESFVANNGKEAIDLTLSGKPDLILMDINMPVMDGLKAARYIRSIEGFRHLPIIAVTGSTGPESVEKQKRAGITDHLFKPMKMNELFAVIDKYV